MTPEYYDEVEAFKEAGLCLKIQLFGDKTWQQNKFYNRRNSKGYFRQKTMGEQHFFKRSFRNNLQ